MRSSENKKTEQFSLFCFFVLNRRYSGLNLNQDKATKPQTVQIVRQGEATPYWFKVNPLYSLLGGRGRMKRYGLSRQYSAISMPTVWKKSA